MMNLLLIFGLAFLPTDTFAAGTFIADSAKVSPARDTPFKLEFRVFSRKSNVEEWQKIDSGAVCFSTEKGDSNPCYQSVGRRISIIEVPKDPQLNPVVNTDYTYAIEFSEPADGKTRVTMIQRVFRSSEKEDSWYAVYPSLLSAANDTQTGAWSALEYQQEQDSFQKLEVRLIPTH